MAYHITHTTGEMESCPSLSILPHLLDELEVADEEHGDIALTHESEWCISVSGDGSVTFEHLEGGDPQHMRDVPRAKILDLLTRLASGEIDKIKAEPWIPGYR